MSRSVSGSGVAGSGAPIDSSMFRAGSARFADARRMVMAIVLVLTLAGTVRA